MHDPEYDAARLSASGLSKSHIRGIDSQKLGC